MRRCLERKRTYRSYRFPDVAMPSALKIGASLQRPPTATEQRLKKVRAPLRTRGRNRPVKARTSVVPCSYARGT